MHRPGMPTIDSLYSQTQKDTMSENRNDDSNGLLALLDYGEPDDPQITLPPPPKRAKYNDDARSSVTNGLNTSTKAYIPKRNRSEPPAAAAAALSAASSSAILTDDVLDSVRRVRSNIFSRP